MIFQNCETITSLILFFFFFFFCTTESLNTCKLEYITRQLLLSGANDVMKSQEEMIEGKVGEL